MKLIVSCEDTGLIKVITASHGTDTSKPSTDDSQQIPVTITTHATNYTRKDKVLQSVKSKISNNLIVTRQNGSIEVYDTSKLFIEPSKETEKDDTELTDSLPLLYEHKNVISPLTSKDGEIFVCLLIDSNDRIVAVTNRGSLFIWLSENKIEQKPVKFLLPLNENENIEAVQSHPGKDYANYFAYGGKETDLRIIKLPSLNGKEKSKPEIVFKAKNVSNSKLELRVPIHIKKILFDKLSTPENFKLYTFTYWGEMRFYEAAQGRKPRSSLLVLPKKAPIINAIWMKDEFVISDNTGIVVKVNPLSGSQIAKFKGQIGTTQALDNYNDLLLATSGSDRYVRVYDNETRDCLVKVFIGTQSNSIMILSDEELKSKQTYIGKVEARDSSNNLENNDDNNEESSDEEELWSKLDSNITQRRKRRKLTTI